MRRGEWGLAQAFFIFFFLLLCILAFIMLSLQSRNVQPVEFDVALQVVTQENHMALMGLLRQPVDGIDVDGDGIADRLLIADLISLGAGQPLEQEIRQRIESAVPDGTYYRMTIEGPYEMSLGNMEEAEMKMTRSQKITLGYVSEGEAIIPSRKGNIRVGLLYLADHSFEHLENERLQRLIDTEAATRRG